MAKKRDKKKEAERVRKAEALLSEGMLVSPEIEPLWRDPLIITDDKKVLTVSDLVHAIRISHGIPIFAARFLGINRSKFEYYVKHNRRLAQVVKHERESIIDLAEGRLYEALADGSPWAIRYVLDTQGKDRGWTTEIIKASREGELFRNIEAITAIDKEEMEAYDEEQKTHDYDKRSQYEVNGLNVDSYR